MYIFKTSGETFESVIKNQKHAYPNKPKYWFEGEIVLVSKNKNACFHGEKQIQYMMRILDIRQVEDDEIEEYWPGNRGRWKWIIDCYDTIKLNIPFGLDVLTNPTKNYRSAQLFTRIDHEDELELMKYLDEE